VVDDEGCVWVNEVEGCRVWRFDSTGKAVMTLGDGKPGFQSGIADFDEVRFNWIYDIRRGPDGNIHVLDRRNFAVRMIDGKTIVSTPLQEHGMEATMEIMEMLGLQLSVAIQKSISTDQYRYHLIKKTPSLWATGTIMLCA
jgi:hypothetical protein